MDSGEAIKRATNVLESINIRGRVRTGQTYVDVSFMEIAKYDVELAERFDIDAEETMRVFEIAAEQLMDTDVKNFRVRIKDLLTSHKVLVREIRGEKHYNKLSQIEGRVKTKSKVRPKIVSARFECPACGNMMSVLVLDDKVKEPRMCGCGRRGKFRMLIDALEKTNTFVISLQEPEDMVNIGSDLQTITCIFKDDLCDFDREQQIFQGCRVILNGIIKQVLVKDNQGNVKAVVDHFFEVVSVQNIEGDFSNVEIEQKDIEKIKEISQDPDMLIKVTKDIFGQIQGYENVKTAILLSMFAGNTFIEKELQQRGLIHILLIGDPGAGKTDLMLLAGKYHPKSMYINVAGGSTSDVGLNSSVVKDELTGEWTFSAGAVPMMHKGMLMVDEINELSNPQALQESLEQMRVTVAKANIKANLKAETTILGSCNPKSGRFDPFLNIYEQIDMPPQLVNRFDLIFPFRDVRNIDRDNKIASSILDRHKEEKDKDTKEAEITPQLLKKWIIHAQQFKPSLPEDVRTYMREKYVEIRNKVNQALQEDMKYKPVPISPRQLQAMVRVAQALTKMKLQKKVNKERARFAVELVISSLELIGVDPETGEIDIQRLEGSLVASARNKIDKVRQIIYEADEIEIGELVKKVEELGMSEYELDALLVKLKASGDCFEPRGGMIKAMK